MVDGTAGRARFGAIGRALSNRNFAIYTAGNIPSVLGTWVQRVAVGWLTWQLTESGTWLGLMGFADLFPIVVCSALAGVIADRVDRLTIAKVVQVIAAIQAISLTALTALDLITVELLFVLTLIGGIDQAFYQPVRQALVQTLVRRADVPAAIAINSVAWNTARFVGPAIAGLILNWGEAWMAFTFNAVTYSFLLAALWAIRSAPEERSARHSEGLIAELRDGYTYAFRHPAIRPAFLILGTAALCARPVVELLPGFAAGVFARGPEGLAWLTSAMGIGAMAAGVWLGQRGRLAGITAIAVTSLLAAGLVITVFGSTRHFAIAVAAMAAFGVVQVVIGTSIQTMVQTIAAPAMRGRVLATYGMIWIGGASVGALVMGGLSEFFGLRPPIIAGAVICVVAWLWAMRLRRHLAQLVESAT